LIVDSQNQNTKSPTMFNFEKLEVWKKSIELADTIYARTRLGECLAVSKVR